MINRRSVPPSTAHACISTINRKQKTPDGNLRASLLKTDMTADQAASGDDFLGICTNLEVLCNRPVEGVAEAAL
ncbi:MAG: hypothetical protein ACJ8AW_31870 [Rhodopila sp.]